MSHFHVKFHYMDMNVYLFGSLHKMTNNINEDETITKMYNQQKRLQTLEMPRLENHKNYQELYCG